ncbi:MAG: oligosaccharide flippase family protein [Sedimentisphaerales bacterium]|nr:oligosaccharide flippase family protein [Sedimentisphaerales bacterium]
MGVWMVLSTVLTFMQFSNLGIGSAITKLVAEEYGRGNKQGMQSYITTALLTVTVTGFIALIFLIILAKPIIALFKLGIENTSIALQYLPYMGILTVYAFFVQILTAALSGLGRMDQSNYRDAICRGISVLVTIVLLFLGKGIQSLFIGMIISNVLMHIISVLLIHKIVDIQILKFKWDYERFKQLINFGGAILCSMIISMFFGPFNKFMLSRYSGIATVPVYEIAFNSSMQIRNLIESAFRALVPEISRIGSNMNLHARERIIQIYRRSLKLIFIFGIPIYILLLIFSPVLLRIWLRDKFVDTLPGAFCIMLVGTFLTLVGVPAYYTLIGFGRVREIIKISIMSGISNVFFVIGYYEITGTLSVYNVGLCFIFSSILPLLYILFKIHYFFTMDRE